MGMKTELAVRLPAWLRDMAETNDLCLDSTEARMRFVVGLARRNVERKTGGPFAAAVFESDSGRLVAAGVNLVEASNCSIAHAEMIAVALAQQALEHYDLGADRIARELVSSTEPCAMCLGAIPWSGVRRVVCGARGEDACGIGFDEGAKPPNWVAALQERGIEVARDVLRSESRAVLQTYLDSGGPIYNARQG